MKGPSGKVECGRIDAANRGTDVCQHRDDIAFHESDGLVCMAEYVDLLGHPIWRGVDHEVAQLNITLDEFICST